MRLRAVPLALSALLTAALIAGPAGASADPSFPEQWNLAQIGAEQAWSRSTGEGVRIGIIDTGADLTHEDIAGKVVAHTSCVGSGGDPAKCAGTAQDDHGHGTHVAGIAAAFKDNGKGIAGVAADAELVVVKVLSAAGGGTDGDVVAGVKWAVDHGAKVINLSLGDPNFILTSLLGTSLAEGIEYAWQHGAVPVLASGNTNLLGLGLGSSNYGDLPAIVVGATGPGDEMADYSSPVGDAKWSIAAPGGAGGVAEDNVLSAWWEKGKLNQYRALAGTSMATPHVAGAVALLLAQGYTPEAAVARLLETADPDVACGCSGRLDVAAATG